MRRSSDCLIFITGIPLLVRWHLYIETPPRLHVLLAASINSLETKPSSVPSLYPAAVVITCELPYIRLGYCCTTLNCMQMTPINKYCKLLWCGCSISILVFSVLYQLSMTSVHLQPLCVLMVQMMFWKQRKKNKTFTMVHCWVFAKETKMP